MMQHNCIASGRGYRLSGAMQQQQQQRLVALYDYLLSEMVHVHRRAEQSARYLSGLGLPHRHNYK